MTKIARRFPTHQRTEPHAGKAESQKQQPLGNGQQRAAENFAEHHDQRQRRHQDRLQKALTAILDDRDRGKDGGEQQNQNQRARKEVCPVRDRIARGPRHAKRRAKPRAKQQPENDRLADGPHDAIALADEPHPFARDQRADRQEWASGGAGVRACSRESTGDRVASLSIFLGGQAMAAMSGPPEFQNTIVTFLQGGHHPCGDPCRRGLGDALKNVGPAAQGCLAEETHRGIPGGVVAAVEPTPIGQKWQRQPNRRPKAPAKCARAVFGATTRSTLLITAAVSMKGPAPSSSRSERSTTGKSTAAICSDPNPFCRLISRTPGTRPAAQNWANGIESRTINRIVAPALPGDADLEAVDRGQLLTPTAAQNRIGPEIGILRGIVASSLRNASGALCKGR